jgi:hypothetical protein
MSFELRVGCMRQDVVLAHSILTHTKNLCLQPLPPFKRLIYGGQ